MDGLAENTVPLMFAGERADKRIISIRYPHGAGHVYFGYSPADPYYVGANRPLTTVLQPNILAMMYELTLKDSDTDGLKDIHEINHGTSPFGRDYDGDGLLDGFEVKYGFDPKMPGEQLLDSDGDGLNNLREQELGTHPHYKDSDEDGLWDGAEVDQHNSDPLNEDTDYDRVLDPIEIEKGANPRTEHSDADEISDYDEIYTYGTLPGNSDTDNDGLSDFIELKGPYADILDPKNIHDAGQDFDEDGLSNKRELLETLTNPKVRDTDQDGLDDGEEVELGLNPLDKDWDKDGLLDGEDSEPKVADELAPQVSLLSPAAGSPVIVGQQLRLRAQASDNGRLGLLGWLMVVK